MGIQRHGCHLVNGISYDVSLYSITLIETRSIECKSVSQQILRIKEFVYVVWHFRKYDYDACVSANAYCLIIFKGGNMFRHNKVHRNDALKRIILRRLFIFFMHFSKRKRFLRMFCMAVCMFQYSAKYQKSANVC